MRDVLCQLWLQSLNANSIAGAIALVLICGYVQITQEDKQHGIGQVLLKQLPETAVPFRQGPLGGLGWATQTVLGKHAGSVACYRSLGRLMSIPL